MDYRTKFISIPEYDFTDYGEIVDRSLLEETYKGIVEEREVSILFTNTSIDQYDKLTKKLISNNNHIKELLIFTNQYDKIEIFHDCVVEDISIRINQPDYRRASIKNSSDIPLYNLDIILKCDNIVMMDSIVFDRHKKIEQLLKNIKR